MRSPAPTLLRLLGGLLAILTLCCVSTVEPLAPPRSPRARAPAPAPAPVRPPPISLTTTDGSGLVLATVRAHAVVEDPLALTELELTFENPRSTTVEGRFEILLPPGASVTRFATWQDYQWKEAEVVERQHARLAYEASLHEGRDPALLERDTGNRFRARVFPIEPYERTQLVVAYTQQLTDPTEPYRLLARDLPWLEQLEVEVLLTDPAGGPPRREHRRFVSEAPGRDIVIPRDAPTSAGIRRGKRVVARIDPLADTDPGPTQPIRRLTVLLDGSASRALDYDEVVARLDALLRSLSRGASTAQLELVVFDQGVETVYDGPLAGLGRGPLATLHARRPLGATDLEGALEALTATERDRLLLVTDGLVSAGTDSNLALGRALSALGRRGLERVDVLAVGHVRDDGRLQHLATALSRSGVVLDGEAPVEDSARRMLQPTFDRVLIDVPGAAWWYPRRVDGLQPGDSLLVHAELDPERSMVVQVSGPVHVEHPVTVRDGGSPLVDHAWMQGRVESLIERVEVLQDALESDRLRALAVSLSVRHRILNDLTAMLVLDGDEDYERFGIDRRAPPEILVVGPKGAELQTRGTPEPEPEPEPEPVVDSEVTPTEEPPRTGAGSISGRVSHQDEGTPIPNALVILQCSCLAGTRETQTNAQGLYRFSDLPPGSYTIQVLSGQADVSKVTTLPSGAKFRANFSIDPQAEFLRAIRVMSRSEYRRSERRARRENKALDGRDSPTAAALDPAARPSRPAPATPPPATTPAPPSPADTAQPLGNESAPLEIVDIPVGNSTSRDFTQVVETTATVSRDSAGISLAGTTSAESVYVMDGANVSAPASLPSRDATVVVQATTVSGDVPRRTIRRGLGYRRPLVERCYFAALSDDEELWGRIRVELRLDAKGRVTRVGKRWQVALDDEELLRCIEEVLTDMTFPDAEGHGAMVATTFIFAPFDGVPYDFDPSEPEPPPPSPTAPWSEIDEALAQAPPRHARALAWAWRERAPTDVLALLSLGRVAEATGDPALAARAYGSILDLHPSQASMRRLAASHLLVLDDPEARALAIDALQTARSQRPDHLTGHRQLAMALLRDDRPREAFEALAEGLKGRYPPGRFAGAGQVLRDDLGMAAAAWLAASPTDAPQIEDRLRELGATLATTPSLRFVLSWETDASDLDLQVQDGEGNLTTGNQLALPTGGHFVADVDDGYGPEAFTFPDPPAAYPYRLSVYYYERGPMGYGMGRVQVIRHDGQGHVEIEERPFALLDESGWVDLGLVGPETRPSLAHRAP